MAAAYLLSLNSAFHRTVLIAPLLAPAAHGPQPHDAPQAWGGALALTTFAALGSVQLALAITAPRARAAPAALGSLALSVVIGVHLS